MEQETKLFGKDERVFVHGVRHPHLEGNHSFIFNKEMYDCYDDFLDEKVDLVFDPIEDYIFQLDQIENKDQNLRNAISVLIALTAHAKREINTWMEDAEKHIGRLNLRRVSHRRGNGLNLKPEEAVAGELLFYGGRWTMSLEDLCLPIAKIRLVADILDIDNYGAKYEHGFVEIPGQSMVGANCILLEVANEVEQTTRQEFDKWWDERKQYEDTIHKLRTQIKQLQEEVANA